MAARKTAKKATKKAAKKAAGRTPKAKDMAPKRAAKKAIGGKTGAKTVARKTAKKTTAAKRPAGKAATPKSGSRQSAARTAAAKKAMSKKAISGKTSGAKTSAAKTSAARAASKKANARPAPKTAGKPAAKKLTQPAPRAVKTAARSAARKPVEKPTAAKRPLAPPKPAAATPVAVKPESGQTDRKPPAAGIAVTGAAGARHDEILSSEALAFLGGLHRAFDARRRKLLAARMQRQVRFDAGEMPDFLPETQAVRDGDWRVAPIPASLQDRRVEITGPVDRKMIVNALNSGAKVFMADFEDASSPTWANMIEGQINLKDLWAGKIAFTDKANGKHYAVGKTPAVLMVRPRGWHLPEAHVTVDGKPMSGSLFDFGLYVFHTAKAQMAQGATPAFYLPKMESHLEARLWNDVFVHAQKALGIANGTFKATVLIETLPAAFEMDEIIHELRDHMAGLNCGRWDYIFSYIKRLGKNAAFLTPDRSAMTMGKDFLAAYSLLLIKTCHRRGAFAMGGMAAQIPIKNNPEANEAAFAKVRADKEREAGNGHDGTWVAHPDLVPVAMEVFDRLMPQANQLDKLREDVEVTPEQLVKVHAGERTEAGLREDIRVGVQYIEAWLRGRGAVPLYNLMEDAATAEISRAQVWQWLYHKATLDDGRAVTPAVFREVMAHEMARVRDAVGADVYDGGRFAEATKLFSDMSLAKKFEEFLTLPAYGLLT